MKRPLKHASAPFLASSLPPNRRAEFGDLVKHRYKTLLLIGAFLLLFTLPALFISFAVDYARNAYLTDAANQSLSSSELYAGVAAIKELGDLYLIPAIIIIYLGFAGLIRIIHELIWGEGVFFFHDWLKGFRENWLAFLMVGALTGVIHYLEGLIYDLAGLNIVVRLLPYLLDADLIWPIGLVFLSLSSIYKMKVGTRIYDGFVFFVKGFPFVLLFALGLLSPLLLNYINIVLLKYGLLIVIIFGIGPLYFLGFELYLAYLYDRYLNGAFLAQRYRGLYHPAPLDSDEKKKK